MIFLLFLVMTPRVQPDTVPNVDILEINDEMREFLDRVVMKPSPDQRLQKLAHVIFSEEFLNLKYDNARTKTAIETYKTGKGNCLSFTTMFIAMARYLGLDAKFQEVYILPVWNRKGDTVMLSRHINAVVSLPSRTMTVDFNPFSENRWFSKNLIEDNRALAQYYNNIGAEHYASGNWSDSILYFQKAIAVDSDLSYGWSNLGVAFRKTGDYQEAERAYLTALSLNKREYSAMINLSSLYSRLGREKLADRYRQKAERFRKRNPYHHFQLGEDAYAENDFEKAIQHFKRAIRRKNYEHQFHFSLAKAYAKLGEWDKASASLKKAREFAPDAFNVDRYNHKLEMLAVNH